MKKQYPKIKVLLLGIVILFCSCKKEDAQPIPGKHLELSQVKYDEYLNLLTDAYNTNNDFDAAMQLANLKFREPITFQLLNKAINEEPEKCERIYEWYWLHVQHNFGMNILKLDTVEFKKVVNLCDRLSQNISYREFAKIKDNEEALAEENKVVEDAEPCNKRLTEELKIILEDDQRIRNRVFSKDITPDLKNKLMKEMQVVDSINLMKIDKIFKEYGYPSREFVGREGNFTPALVIHHSKSLETRYKYLPFLEKAVEDGLLYEGTLDMIKRRIKNIEAIEGI